MELFRLNNDCCVNERQKITKYIILDLEATCWEGQTDKKREIIEIGVVAINEDRIITDEFVQIVRQHKIPAFSVLYRSHNSHSGYGQ